MEASETCGPTLEARPLTRPVRGFLFDALVFGVLMVVVGVAAGIAWAVVQGIGAGLAGTAPPDVLPVPDGMALVWLTALATGGPAVVLYAWRRRASATERATSMQAARNPATWGLAAGVAGAVYVFAHAVQRLLAGAGVQVEATNAPLIQAGMSLDPVTMLLFAAVVAPAYEELVFRRVLFGRLWAAGRPWLGIVLSSAVFALAHEVPGLGGNPLGTTFLLWLLYGTMGAAFAWVYWRTGTLWAAFAAHGLYNLVSCLPLLGVGQ